MTTLTDIVQQALRESGVIPVGSTPDSDVFNEAFARLKTIIQRIFGDELGEYLIDVDYPSIGCTQMEANTRLLCNNTGNVSLKMPKAPMDGSRFAIVDVGDNFDTYPVTLEGNGRKIEGASQVVLGTSTPREWFYRADLGQWKEVIDLTESSEQPFPSMYDDFLSTLLAIRLNYRYGVENDIQVFMALRKRFKSQYRQYKNTTSDLALLRLSTYRGSSDFNRGT